MPDDNILKFQRPAKKPVQQQSGKPSLVTAIVVMAIAVAIVVGITVLFGGFR